MPNGHLVLEHTLKVAVESPAAKTNGAQAFGEFELVVFGDEVILHRDIEEWPLCDALLSWHSEGFPLRKVRCLQQRTGAAILSIGSD